MLLSRTESLLPRPKLYRNMIRNFNHQKWQKIITAYHRQVGRHVRSLTNFLHDLLCNPYTIPTEKWQFAAVLPFLTQKTLRASFGVNIQDIHCQKPTNVVVFEFGAHLINPTMRCEINRCSIYLQAHYHVFFAEVDIERLRWVLVFLILASKCVM